MSQKDSGDEEFSQLNESKGKLVTKDIYKLEDSNGPAPDSNVWVDALEAASPSLSELGLNLSVTPTHTYEEKAKNLDGNKKN